MGTLEEKNKKIVRRTEIQEAILSTIAVAGILSATLVAPQIMSALHKLDLLPSFRRGEIIKSSASRLRKKGLIKFEEGYYSLTEEGKKILEYWQMTRYKINKPKRWDHKWRIIIFDIAERKKKTRERIREIFKSVGFRRLQDSVWIYPYDCEDVIGLLKTEQRVGKEILYIIADQIENDKYLREDFKLL